jgi:hypothetical protein
MRQFFTVVTGVSVTGTATYSAAIKLFRRHKSFLGGTTKPMRIICRYNLYPNLDLNAGQYSEIGAGVLNTAVRHILLYCTDTTLQ